MPFEPSGANHRNGRAISPVRSVGLSSVYLRHVDKWVPVDVGCWLQPIWTTVRRPLIYVPWHSTVQRSLPPKFSILRSECLLRTLCVVPFHVYRFRMPVLPPPLMSSSSLLHAPSRAWYFPYVAPLLIDRWYLTVSLFQLTKCLYLFVLSIDMVLFIVNWHVFIQ